MIRRAWRRRLILRRPGMYACCSRECGYLFAYRGRGKWEGPYGATFLTPEKLTRRQLEDSYGDCAAGLVGADALDYATACTGPHSCRPGATPVSWCRESCTECTDGNPTPCHVPRDSKGRIRRRT